MSLFFVTCLRCCSNSPISTFQNLAEAAGNSQLRTVSFVSKSEVPQNFAVAAAILKMRNCVILLRPFLSATSFKNTDNYKHSGSAPFLSWSAIIDSSSKTPVVISILGVPLFCCRLVIFIIFTFLLEIVNFAAFTKSLILLICQNCCISIGKHHILPRSRNHHFGPYFTLAARS